MPAMKRFPILIALALTAGTMTTLALPVVAVAQSQAAKAAVDAAKAAGKVGEQGDGSLGTVTDADRALRSAVTEISAGRKQVYSDTAAKTGVTTEAAGEAPARALIGRVPAGQFFKPL